MTCNTREFFKLFFGELEKRGIAHVILHSYQEFPEKITSDIDYAVPDKYLPGLRAIQSELARKNGWALVQTLQHGVFAYYAVLVNLENPAEFLKLDACSNYARARRFLVPEKVLLENRIPCRGFYIPAPAAEFIYVLAKVFDAKHKSPAKYLPRLKDLWQQDPAGAQTNFDNVFGNTGKTLEQWFSTPADDWKRLGTLMLARNRFGPVLMLRESARVVKRAWHPTGFSFAVLGSDGSGKTTLLARVRTLLEPCFRYQQTLHFRPQVLRKRTPGDDATITNPHGQTPENPMLSWLKVGYYFADHWAGWALLVLPGRIRSTLVIFDRDFDDMLVDQKRYRLSGCAALVRVLRALVPHPQRTFILSAPAAVLHQRKPELSVVELERQQQVFQQLATDQKRYLLISAELPPDRVAEIVWREVVLRLAAREEKRT